MYLETLVRALFVVVVFAKRMPIEQAEHDHLYARGAIAFASPRALS